MISTEVQTLLIDRLGREFNDPAILHRALAHRSWCAEHPGELSNERLEFLGDAVLGLVITDYLFKSFPERSEGWLSQARASLVRAGTLTDIARHLHLGDAMLLGKGEAHSGGREKASILADAVEAVIGAVYVDDGMEAARSLVIDLMGDRLTDVAGLTGPATSPLPHDHKSRLQEHCAQNAMGAPDYTWTEDGLEHEKSFTVALSVDGEVVGHGIGRSKKQAEQIAASAALTSLGIIDESPDNTATPPSSPSTTAPEPE